MHISFSAPDSWINSIFRQSREFKLPQIAEFSHPTYCFAKVLPLMAHDAITSDRAFQDGYAPDPTAIVARLKSTFPCTSVRDFEKGASILMGADATIRPGSMRLRTQNALTADFIPPTHSTLLRALPISLKRSCESLGRAETDACRVGAALASYFVLLTLHPLRDGNGRTARYYFSACISTLSRISPTFLLALAAMHGNQSSAFHLAAKVGRMGNMSMLLDLYSENLMRAQEMFDIELRDLDQSFSEERPKWNESFITPLTQIRSRLNAHMIN